QPGQVYDDAVGGAPPHVTMAPAAHGDFQSLSAGEFDRVPDVVGVDTPCNQRWSSLYVGIPKIDTSCCVIVGVCWENQTPLQLCAESLECVRIDLASVSDFELSRGCRQPQRSGDGEGALDELATTLVTAKLHSGKSSSSEGRHETFLYQQTQFAPQRTSDY